jgi:hypothetical protein
MNVKRGMILMVLAMIANVGAGLEYPYLTICMTTAMIIIGMDDS